MILGVVLLGLDVVLNVMFARYNSIANDESIKDVIARRDVSFVRYLQSNNEVGSIVPLFYYYDDALYFVTKRRVGKDGIERLSTRRALITYEDGKAVFLHSLMYSLISKDLYERVQSFYYQDIVSCDKVRIRTGDIINNGIILHLSNGENISIESMSIIGDIEELVNKILTGIKNSKSTQK